MQPEQKLSILMDGQKNGISDTCIKHQISRTLYYRWLKRYKNAGIAGLGKTTRNFTPPNKTEPAIIQMLMNLIKKYPNYGPRALKYKLDDLGYKISESAVYNSLRRHGLSTKKQRLSHIKKKDTHSDHRLPSFSPLDSGECWLFWTTYVGNFKNVGDLYIYTFLDYKSRIACSRLYTRLSLAHFENLLTAVAMPVAQSLNFDTKYLYVSYLDHICQKKPEIFVTQLEKILLSSGFDASVFTQIAQQDEGEILHLMSHYNQITLSELLLLIQEGLSLNEILHKFQHHIRNYNLHSTFSYDQQLYTPVAYHAKSRDLKLILPLWAYMDRDY